MIGAIGRRIASIFLPSGPAVHQRLEVALVRELEVAYSSGTAPAVVAHARGYQWANACHDLFEAGRIDIVEYAARYLHPLYPELTYLATLVAMFDAMPRHPPAPLAFRNDPTEEIQVVRRPDCDSVLLCFCAAGGNIGLPANFIHPWLGRLPTSLVYIKDLRNFRGGCGYPTLGPDRASSITAFRRLADEIGGKKIFTVGVSRGGYPALYYGLELGAVAVLSLAGATDYTREFVDTLGPVPRAYLNLAERAPDYFRNLRASCASAHKTRVLIAYGAGNPRDRKQAERIAGLPNVELIALDYAQHNVIEPLIRQGELLPLLDRFLSTGRTMA
jgi:pimeloyl-ACP methyl ester carboxylesterase